MSTTWFTSDQHFGHARIIELCGRPFSSVEEMDEVIIARHNELVAPDDVVYHLGDYAMGDRSRGLGYISRMSGTHILIVGNHEKCFAGDPKGWKYRGEYLDAGFAAVMDHTVVKLPPTQGKGRRGMGRQVVLSHFPYAGDHTDRDRHRQWRPRDEGAWLVHGHVHDLYTVRGRGVNVGVDRWDFRPVSAMTVHELIEDVEAGRTPED